MLNNQTFDLCCWKYTLFESITAMLCYTKCITRSMYSHTCSRQWSKEKNDPIVSVESTRRKSFKNVQGKGLYRIGLNNFENVYCVKCVFYAKNTKPSPNDSVQTFHTDLHVICLLAKQTCIPPIKFWILCP